jgi:hypothetical protein
MREIITDVWRTVVLWQHYSACSHIPEHLNLQKYCCQNLKPLNEMVSSKINDRGTEPYQCELVCRTSFTCTKCLLPTLAVIIMNYDNSYKDSLTMAYAVCQNMLENW